MHAFRDVEMGGWNKLRIRLSSALGEYTSEGHGVFCLCNEPSVIHVAGCNGLLNCIHEFLSAWNLHVYRSQD
jgi:hypothetical protein